MNHDPTSQLLTWYRQAVRPLLQAHGTEERVSELDGDAERVERLQAAAAEQLAVCFLGESGVGKSTLINALVAGKDSVLPSGGVGPLTALAMGVRFADEPAFEAHYHPPKQLWRLAFALQVAGKDALVARGGSPDSLAEKPDFEVAEDLAGEGDDSLFSEGLELYAKQAQLLVCGDQDGGRELPYLIDSLRTAMGMPRAWGTTLLEEDAARLARLRSALQLARSNTAYKRAAGEDVSAFKRDLREHAAGALAPLIQRLQVYWNSDLLRAGVGLIDLPGLGVSADVFKATTVEWIRGGAKAIVLVVDRAGVKEQSAVLLRESGFLARLLYAIDDPKADPLVLMVAVVRVDDVAQEEYRNDDTKTETEYFVEVCAKMQQTIRRQLKQELEKVWAAEAPDGASAGLSEGRQSVVDRVLSQVKVFPLSAVEYRKFLLQNSKQPPFLDSPDQTGVPAFQEGIAEIVMARRRDAAERLAEAQDVLWGRGVAAMALLRSQWGDRTRAADETERLAEELDAFLRSRRDEFNTRRGSFREFLKNGIPDRIESLVVQARDSARSQFKGYLTRNLRNAHWKTLQASVRKEGRHAGSTTTVDLPAELAQRFEEPVAEIWSTDILKSIRTRTRHFADDCVKAVGEVVQWARKESARVQPTLVEAIEDDVKADIKKIDLIGKEGVNKLRDRVRARLVADLERAIADRCRAFVARGENQGTGVKLRILELFDRLADEASASAARPAKAILVDSYKEVYDEIKRELRNLDNPLDTARDQIVAANREHIERSDAQKRRRVLGALDEVLAAAPPRPLGESAVV